MATNFTITLEGEKQLIRRLNKLAVSVKDFRPELQKSTSFLKGFFGVNVFASRGAAIGEPWVARKEQYPWPILEKTGRMKRSFMTKAERLKGTVWNAVNYFKYHQSALPRFRLPRRVMMKLTSQLKNEIIRVFHKGLIERTNK